MHGYMPTKGNALLRRTNRLSNVNEKQSLRRHPHTLEEFENGSFTLKTHQMLSVHATPGKFNSATNTDHFGFVFDENSVREITRLSCRLSFLKALFSKCSPSTRKQKAGVFKFLRLEERFLKAPFSRRNKTVFSNFSGLAWTLPQK